MSGELVVLEAEQVTKLDNVEIIDAGHKLRVIRIVNPFNPRERVMDELDWAPTKTLADYFPAGTGNTVVSINGRIVPFDDFPVTYLSPEDNLVICPVPHGGGNNGKSIIGAIAMIAVAVFAPYAAPALYGGDAILAGAALGSAGVAAVTAGVTIAGALLVNSLVAPGKASSEASSIGASSISYGIDGAKNTSLEGLVVPVLYGEFRMGGNLIDTFVVNSGDTQILYMRMVISEGGIAYVGDFEINDQPANLVPGVAFDVRGGWGNDSVMGWFADTIRPMTKSSKVTNDWSYHQTDSIDKYRLDLVCPSGLFFANPSTGQLSPNQILFECQHRNLAGGDWEKMNVTAELMGYRRATAVKTPVSPTGSRTMVEDGIPYYWVNTEIVWMGFYWRIIDGHWERSTYSASWTWAEQNAFGAGATYADQAQGALIRDQGLIDYLNANATSRTSTSYANSIDFGTVTEYFEARVPIYQTQLMMQDAKRAAVRKSFMSQQLARGEYEIRWRRIGLDLTADWLQDDVYCSDVNEILLEDLTYPHTAKLGVQVILNEQISGMPKVTFLARGRCIYVNRWVSAIGAAEGRQWLFEYSNNPAWIVWDILTNTRFGGGLAWDRLDLPAFQRFADHCSANGLTWNGPIDSEMNVWDACQLVLRVGRAQLVGVGTRYTVVMEAAAQPVMMFSVANIIEGTFKETWLSLADRANEIEVTYFDKADKYKQRTLKVYDPTALQAGRPQKSSAITLYGVTDHDQAYREGVFQLNLNRYVLQTVEFGAPIEAVACTVGDLIYVQHDMPQWGFAGRCEAGSTTTVVNLDRTVKIEGGKNYKLLVSYDVMGRWDGTITQIIGNNVWVSVPHPGIQDCSRFKAGGLEKAITGIFDQGGGGYGFILQDVSGLTVGMAYGAWSTDYLAEANVVPMVGESATVQVTSPLPLAPATFAKWMFGEVGKLKKPFRVKAINGSHDYRRDITAVEYNDSVYNLSAVAVPVPNYSSLSSKVEHVQIDSVEEILFAAGTSFRSHVTVHFHHTQETYARSSVYYKVEGAGANWVLLDDNAFDRATVDLEEGVVATFKVVARDVVGMKAQDATAPKMTYTVLGKLAPPQDVKGFTSSIGPSAIVLKWTANDDIDLYGYEIREGTAWDSAAPLVNDFSGTTFLVPKNDGGTYTFLIRAIDTSDKRSVNPVVTTITLSPPAAVAGFDCVQNGSRIEFRWDANKEPRISGYEIREGETWGVGKLVTRVNATTYSMPSSSIAGARTFWIKAIVEPGVPSTQAMFSTTEIAQPTDRNLIVLDDQLAAGWPGSKFQLSVQNFALQLDAGKNYGEYTWGMTLPKSYRARNSIDSSFGAVILDDTNWVDASWSWTDTQAERAWIVAGDLNTVDLRYYISRYVGLEAKYTEGFSLSGTTDGERGTVAAHNSGVTYGPGRFLEGAVIDDATTLDWDLEVPAQFNTSFWAIPTDLGNDQVYWTGTTADGKKLILGYEEASKTFWLSDDAGGPDLAVPYAIEVADRVLLAIVQTATDRKLYVGKLNAEPAFGQVAAAPIGALANIALH